MKKTQEQLLNEELGRFMSINKYIGGIAEQEEETAEVPAEVPAEDGAELPTEELPAEDVPMDEPTDAGSEDEVDAPETDGEEGGFGAGLDMETGDDVEMDMETSTEEGDDTEEVDVTDLVDGQKELEEKFKETEQTITQSMEKVDGVFSKLDDLESKMAELDKLYSAIDQLGQKIDQAKPKTPEEKLELRSLDSYPFNQKLTDFFDDKETEMEVTGKNEYVLTSDDVDNVSDHDIKKSFIPNEEE